MSLNLMIEKWIKLKYEYCGICSSNKKCLITYFVHATDDDIDDYWCTLKGCPCNGKLCGNYVKVCSNCTFTEELSETEVDMFD